MENRFKPIVIHDKPRMSEGLKEKIELLKYGQYPVLLYNVEPKRIRKRPITRNKRQYILK